MDTTNRPPIEDPEIMGMLESMFGDTPNPKEKILKGEKFLIFEGTVQLPDLRLLGVPLIESGTDDQSRMDTIQEMEKRAKQIPHSRDVKVRIISGLSDDNGKPIQEILAKRIDDV